MALGPSSPYDLNADLSAFKKQRSTAPSALTPALAPAAPSVPSAPSAPAPASVGTLTPKSIASAPIQSGGLLGAKAAPAPAPAAPMAQPPPAPALPSLQAQPVLPPAPQVEAPMPVSMPAQPPALHSPAVSMPSPSLPSPSLPSPSLPAPSFAGFEGLLSPSALPPTPGPIAGPGPGLPPGPSPLPGPAPSPTPAPLPSPVPAPPAPGLPPVAPPALPPALGDLGTVKPGLPSGPPPGPAPKLESPLTPPDLSPKTLPADGFKGQLPDQLKDRMSMGKEWTDPYVAPEGQSSVTDFVNFDRVLGANLDNARKAQAGLLDKVGANAAGAQGAIGSAFDGFEDLVKKGTLKYKASPFRTLGADVYAQNGDLDHTTPVGGKDPVSGLTAEDIAALGKSGYTGPKSMESDKGYGDLYGKVLKGDQQLNATKGQSGREELYRDIYGKDAGNYTKGMSRLDAALGGATDVGRSAALREKYGSLEKSLNDKSAVARADAEDASRMSDAAARQYAGDSETIKTNDAARADRAAASTKAAQDNELSVKQAENTRKQRASTSYDDYMAQRRGVSAQKNGGYTKISSKTYGAMTDAEWARLMELESAAAEGATSTTSDPARNAALTEYYEELQHKYDPGN